jgi:hypothetical protein
MGVMKRWSHAHRVDGIAVPKAIRILAGLQPPDPTDEEKAAMKTAAAEARAEREAIQAVEREAEAAHAAELAAQAVAGTAARLIAWRAEAGPPDAPQAATGYYRCGNLDGAFFPIGSGPWPDYRPPGLAWDRAWKEVKPVDVPWADEAPPPRVFAADPRPIREAVGKVIQGRMF